LVEKLIIRRKLALLSFFSAACKIKLSKKDLKIIPKKESLKRGRN
jgi:hypothetical protein